MSVRAVTGTKMTPVRVYGIIVEPKEESSGEGTNSHKE